LAACTVHVVIKIFVEKAFKNAQKRIPLVTINGWCGMITPGRPPVDRVPMTYYLAQNRSRFVVGGEGDGGRGTARCGDPARAGQMSSGAGEGFVRRKTDLIGFLSIFEICPIFLGKKKKKKKGSPLLQPPLCRVEENTGRVPGPAPRVEAAFSQMGSDLLQGGVAKPRFVIFFEV